MIEFDKHFEKACEEYLEYLYRLAEKYYNNCPDIDSLVQDTLTALIVKVDRGEAVEHPKGFLSAVLKNQYNAWLRKKYRAENEKSTSFEVLFSLVSHSQAKSNSACLGLIDLKYK